MHDCSAKCCRNLDSSQNEFQCCQENCQVPIMKANSYMQNEMSDMEASETKEINLQSN